MKANSYLIRRLGRDLKSGKCKMVRREYHCVKPFGWRYVIEDKGAIRFAPCALRPTWGKYLAEGRA